MPSRTCPYCDRTTHLTPRWGEVSSFRGSNTAILQGAATCDHCGRASLAFVANWRDFPGSTGIERLNAAEDRAVTWLPKKGVSPEFPDVPQHIERAAKEAHGCFSIQSYMASILMARTVVEATAKEKGITTGRLIQKIDAMAAASIIREDTKDAAHEIRHLGNDMAHGDIEDLPAPEDVEDVLVLMDEVLAEVFQGPARTARLKNKRAATT